jgi:hypothetical protein
MASRPSGYPDGIAQLLLFLSVITIGLFVWPFFFYLAVSQRRRNAGLIGLVYLLPLTLISGGLFISAVGTGSLSEAGSTLMTIGTLLLPVFWIMGIFHAFRVHADQSAISASRSTPQSPSTTQSTLTALQVKKRQEYLESFKSTIENWRLQGLLTADVAEQVLNVTKQQLELLQPRPVEADLLLTPPQAVAEPVDMPAKPAPRKEPVRPRMPRPTPAQAAKVAPEPSGPAFSWRDAGTYILSERTLIALLALGAFMVMVSGFVISIVNPTELSPGFHLAAVATTATIFFAAGYILRTRLDLARTGEVLLAIGGAFVPLATWTLGGDQLLNWSSSTIWLVASVSGLALYACFYSLLNDRAFATLSAIAGGSLLLALTHQFQIPLEWGLCGVVALAAVYLVMSRMIAPRWPELTTALFWTSIIATPAIMLGLMVIAFFPEGWDLLYGHEQELSTYAVGTAWWLGALYAYTGFRAGAGRWFWIATVWIVPVAYLFTLTEAPWSSTWYNLSLAILATCYVLASQEFRNASTLNWKAALQAPVLQVAFGLTVVAGVWPWASLESALLTLYLVVALYALSAYRLTLSEAQYPAAYLLPVAFVLTLEKFHRLDITGFAPDWFGFWLVALATGYILFGYRVFTSRDTSAAALTSSRLTRYPVFQVALFTGAVAIALPERDYASSTAMFLLMAISFGLSTILLDKRQLAYPAALSLLMAFGVAVEWTGPENDGRVLLWAAGAIVFLISAETFIRTAGTQHQSLRHTVLDSNGINPPFSTPLLLSGYGMSLIALLLMTSILNEATVHAASALEITRVSIAALFVIVAGWTASAILRRSSVFLYPAAAIIIIAVTSLAFDVLLQFSVSWSEARAGVVLASIGIGFFAAGLLTDRFRGHYAKPLFLTAYALSVISVLYASFDRAAVVLVLGATIAIYVASAVLVHRGRHPSFQWIVDLVAPDQKSATHRTLQSTFVYLTAGLFPVWVVLTMRLSDELAGAGQYGVALATLAPLYFLVGTLFKRLRDVYSTPWYVSGFALSMLGPIVAIEAPTLRFVALGVSIGVYTGLAYATRHAVWTVLVALLVPVWLWQVLDRTGHADEYFGLALVILSIGYGALALGLHHGSLLKSLRAVSGPFKRLALPFLLAAYLLNTIGLTVVPADSNTQFLFSMMMASILYGGSLGFLRKSLFAYPLVLTSVFAYNTALDMSAISDRFYGIGLLPGVLALFVAAVLIKMSKWQGLVTKPHFARYLELNEVQTPFLIATYSGAALVLVLSTADWTVASIAWWSVAGLFALSVYTFRQPTWIYPAYGSGVFAFGSSVHVVFPELSAATIMATLALPAWAGLWAAYAVALHPGQPPEPRWPYFGSSLAFDRSWSRPLLVAGSLTLLVGLIGASVEAEPGFLIAITAATLAFVFATAINGRVEAWISLALATLALQQALRLAEIGIVDQAPFWAAAALATGLVTLMLHSIGTRISRMWFDVLSSGSIVIGIAAVFFSAAVQLSELNRSALDQLSLTVALFGMTLITHAYVHVSRYSVYDGAAALLSAYALRLVVLEVSEPQAFAIPSGLYLLAITFNEWRRGTRGDVRHLLEVTGLVLILGTSISQSMGLLGAGDDRYQYALLLLVQSLALFGLAAVVHWRYTFFGSIAGTVIAVAVFLEQPLRTMNTWYLLLIIGIAMLIIVGFIERRRQEIPVWLTQWKQRLESWS